MLMSYFCNFNTNLGVFNYTINEGKGNLHLFMVRNSCLVFHSFSCALSIRLTL